EAGDKHPAAVIERQAAGEVVAWLRAGVVGVKPVLQCAGLGIVAPDVVGEVAHKQITAMRAVTIAVRAERDADQADEPEARRGRRRLRDEYAVRAGRGVVAQQLAGQPGNSPATLPSVVTYSPPSRPNTSELGPFRPPG